MSFTNVFLILLISHIVAVFEVFYIVFNSGFIIIVV